MTTTDNSDSMSHLPPLPEPIYGFGTEKNLVTLVACLAYGEARAIYAVQQERKLREMERVALAQHSAPAEPAASIDDANTALAVATSQDARHEALRQLIAACRRELSPPATSTCPWCGTSGPGYDESDRPADYCHHDTAEQASEPVGLTDVQIGEAVMGVSMVPPADVLRIARAVLAAQAQPDDVLCASRYRFLRDNSATYSSKKVPIQLIVQEHAEVHRKCRHSGYRARLDEAIDAMQAATRKGQA